MDRLDKFIEHGGFSKEPEAVLEKEILLYGESETIDRICYELDIAAITYDRIIEPQIEGDTIYHWIGAFSENDENNLFFCLSAKKNNKNIRSMAKCNDRIYENVFKQMGITVVLQNDISINRILACLKG